MPDSQVLAIPGSLRKGSFNRSLLVAAQDLAPSGVHIELFEGLREIPPYDQDVQDQGPPGPVRAFNESIKAADGLLIASPEYNYSVPGVLKNAIDWASRGNPSVLEGKPVGIIGASPGNFGTVRAQLAWRQVFLFTNSPVMLRPELLVFGAADRFSKSGELTDNDTRKFLREYLEAFADWTASHSRRPAAVN